MSHLKKIGGQDETAIISATSEQIKQYLIEKGLVFVKHVVDIAEKYYKHYFILNNNLIEIGSIVLFDDSINLFFEYYEWRNEGRRQTSPQIEKLTPSIQFHIFHIEEEFEKVKPELDRGLECFKKLLEVYHNEYGGEQ